MRKIFIVFFFLGIFISCVTEEPIPTYTLSTIVSPTDGGIITVSPIAQNYKEGEIVTLTAQPNEHWIFQKWEGDESGNTNPLQMIMNSNKSVSAIFVKRDYPLKITIEGEGTVEEKIITNPSGREYPYGTTVELTPIPKDGWQFDSWGGDLTGSESPKSIKVDKEKNVTVKFIQSEKNLLSLKLEKTVWVGDENYRPCDCGFSSIIGFKGGLIFELGEFGSKEPTGCFPYNFLYRDYNGEIKNLTIDEDKISFNIISGTWNWFTEIEMKSEKLKITSSSVIFTWIQEYKLSTIKFDDYCK